MGWLLGEKDVYRGRASHRGHGGHRGGLGKGKAFGGRLGFWAGKARVRGEHRTEVTEVTEGGSGSGRLLVDGLASGRERRVSGESIAQRSRRSQRGDWEGERLLVDGLVSGRERRASGESIAQRSRSGDWEGEGSLVVLAKRWSSIENARR